MKQLCLIIGLILVVSSCEDVNRRSSVPNVRVNYTLNITSEHPHFVRENGFQTMTVTKRRYQNDLIGYAGLLIWVGMDNQYYAADLCCPYCVQAKKPIEVDGIFAICPACGEQYDISYGFGHPTKGVTKEPLKRYNTSFQNGVTGRELHIYN